MLDVTLYISESLESLYAQDENCIESNHSFEVLPRTGDSIVSGRHGSLLVIQTIFSDGSDDSELQQPAELFCLSYQSIGFSTPEFFKWKGDKLREAGCI